MPLSIKSLVISCGLIWGGALLCVGLCNLAFPSYGATFLGVMSSVYPGYHASRTIGDVIVGTGYALVDGAGAGLVFGWLYNFFARPPR